MIVVQNTAESAALSLYNECEDKLPLSDCQKSLKRYRRRMVNKTRIYAKSEGMAVGSGLFSFIFPSLVLWAITLLIKHFLSKKGWV